MSKRNFILSASIAALVLATVFITHENSVVNARFEALSSVDLSEDELDGSLSTPISLTSFGAVTQNFDTLPTTGTALTSADLPAGWGFVEASGSQADTTFAADDGSTSTGNIYSYGTASSTDRAFGSLETNQMSSGIKGVAFTNNTGAELSGFDLSYIGEQWRRGSGTGDKLIFEYCVGCAGFNSGTWTAATSLDFTAPNQLTGTGNVDKPLNGNDSSNRTAVSGSVSVKVEDSQTLLLRWRGSNISNNDDGLAVDDLSFTPVPDAPQTNLTATPNALSNSRNASFSFTSNVVSATFECDLDGSGFETCVSPKTYAGLADGSHTFQVRAKLDSVVDATPASFTWTVDATNPTVTVSSGPSGVRSSISETITFSASDIGGSGVASTQCSLNGASFATCISSVTVGDLSQGPQAFSIRAIDNAGNQSDATVVSWTVDSIKPAISGFTPVQNGIETGARDVSFDVVDAGDIASVVIETIISSPVSQGDFDGPMAYSTETTVSPCSPTVGTGYSCTIPGAPAGSVVSYRISAQDAAGNIATVPATGFYTYLVTSNSGPTELPPGVYDNLELDSSIVIAGDITITGTLTLTGIVSAGDFTVTFSCGAVAVSGPAEFIDGNVAKEFCGGVESFTYPIGVSTPDMISGEIPFGSSGVYAPATVSIQSATVGSSVTINAVLAQMDGSAPTHRIGVYWTTVEVGDITADLTFGWDLSSEIGNPVYYSPLRRALGSTEVVSPGSVDTVSRTVTFTGITEFSSSSPGFDAPNGGIMTEAFEWTAALIGTTAGRNELSGRVVSAEGLPLRGVSVTVVGGDLVAPLTVKTNQFGTYKFSGLEAGSTYVVYVNSGRFVFVNNSRVVYLSDSLSGEDFRAEPK